MEDIDKGDILVERWSKYNDIDDALINMDKEIIRLQAEIDRLKQEKKDCIAGTWEDKLNAENTQLKAKLERHRRIPVTERLPRLNMKVCIYSPTQLGVRTGKYTKNWKGEFFWDVDFTSDVTSYQDTITHWWPIILPEQALKGGE